jgi:hypothetical protein
MSGSVPVCVAMVTKYVAQQLTSKTNINVHEHKHKLFNNCVHLSKHSSSPQSSHGYTKQHCGQEIQLWGFPTHTGH